LAECAINISQGSRKPRTGKEGNNGHNLAGLHIFSFSINWPTCKGESTQYKR
jgi:hypothetical protein